jgi:hypothetical protein
MITIQCTSCGHRNDFDQPYPFHAGFANQGFLYNDEGNLTLIWSGFDPAYEAIVGEKHPWTLTAEERLLFEGALLPAPSGGRWQFINPARCGKCANPISGPITQRIYYLRYPRSIDTDPNPGRHHLKEYLLPPRP